MKEYKVYADIDGKTKEIFIYADGFEYHRDDNICLFTRGKGEVFEIVALFKNNIKAIICNTEEISKRVLDEVKRNEAGTNDTV